MATVQCSLVQVRTEVNADVKRIRRIDICKQYGQNNVRIDRPNKRFQITKKPFDCVPPPRRVLTSIRTHFSIPLENFHSPMYLENIFSEVSLSVRRVAETSRIRIIFFSQTKTDHFVSIITLTNSLLTPRKYATERIQNRKRAETKKSLRCN